MSPRSWIKKTDYPTLEFGVSFEAYRRQRAELLDLLRGLPAEDWQRSALVTGGGRARERSVWFYADWLADHEGQHVRQFLAGRSRTQTW